jgi:hypothetical protein
LTRLLTAVTRAVIESTLVAVTGMAPIVQTPVVGS